MRQFIHIVYKKFSFDILYMINKCDQKRIRYTLHCLEDDDLLRKRVGLYRPLPSVFDKDWVWVCKVKDYKDYN